MDEVTLRVFRYDPRSDEAPSYATGRVPYVPGMTVLMALHRLNEAESIACRHSCRTGSCGVCTVRVNGRHALACQCVIQDPARVVVVEPRKGRPVLRDLIAAPGEG